ncbi:hypothetical protein GF312_07295 [Candidatus Poribacteria bacterium]|nr:hypothetical protein [Candidatus Poribacteria bacterium]
MKDKLKIGVIGAGSFASRRHIPTVVKSSDAELAALCRRDKEKLKIMADHFNCKNTFTDYRKMLDKMEMDAVLVTTPHALHYEHAKAALEKGLHVMIEKPMAVSSREAQELADISRAKNLAVVVALNPPFWSHTTYAKNIIESGVIGEIEAVNISYICNAQHVFGQIPMPESVPGVTPPTLFRADTELGGGGYLVDSGSHLISELLWVTGLNAVEVCAVMDNPELDMRASVNMNLDNRAICSISCIGDSGVSRRLHNIYFGSEATMYVEGMPFKVTICKPDEKPFVASDDNMPQVPQPVDNLINVILGRSKNLCSADDGLAVVKVMEAAYNSAKTSEKIFL